MFKIDFNLGNGLVSNTDMSTRREYAFSQSVQMKIRHDTLELESIDTDYKSFYEPWDHKDHKKMRISL